MNIDVAKGRKLQHPGRNDAPISNHDDGIRRDRPKLLLEFIVLLDLVRLDHRKPEPGRRLLDRRRRHDHASPLRTVRLGNDKLDSEALGGELLQGRNGELRSAAKHQLHFHSPSRMSFLILRLIRSRLRPLTWLMNNFPFRWSVSWRKARANNPSPVCSNHSPSKSWARTVTIFARETFSRKSGKLKHPSPLTCFPSLPMISGLTNTSLALGSSLKVTSITTMRLLMPICGAASPTPWAWYMDSNMSSASWRNSSLNSVTVCAVVSSTGLPYFTIG